MPLVPLEVFAPEPEVLEPLLPGEPTPVLDELEELEAPGLTELFVSRPMLRLALLLSRLEPNPVSRLVSDPAPPRF